MSLDEQFDDFCDRIRAKYRELGYSKQWSFLYTSKATFHPSQQLLFLGLNPGGDEGGEECMSCEDGNDYLVGEWEGDDLQHQVQELFKEIAKCIEGDIDHCQLMNKSLASNYVPFRSSDWSSLKNNTDALIFGDKLWSDILDLINPRVIICMSIPSYNGIKSILINNKELKFIDDEVKGCVNWGNRRYYISRLQNNSGSILLVGLPHLSRHKLLSRGKSRNVIMELSKEIGNKLDSSAF